MTLVKRFVAWFKSQRNGRAAAARKAELKRRNSPHGLDDRKDVPDRP